MKNTRWLKNSNNCSKEWWLLTLNKDSLLKRFYKVSGSRMAPIHPWRLRITNENLLADKLLAKLMILILLSFSGFIKICKSLTLMMLWLNTMRKEYVRVKWYNRVKMIITWLIFSPRWLRVTFWRNSGQGTGSHLHWKTGSKWFPAVSQFLFLYFSKDSNLT